MRGAFCLFAVLLVRRSPICAQEKATNEVRDTLPLGAIERLGSPRFRVTGPVFGARFQRDLHSINPTARPAPGAGGAGRGLSPDRRP